MLLLITCYMCQQHEDGTSRRALAYHAIQSVFATHLLRAPRVAKTGKLVAPWLLAVLVSDIHLDIQSEGTLQCAAHYHHHVSTVLV